MKEEKVKECVGKILEATKEDFPSLLLFAIGKDAGGFVLLTAKEKVDTAKLMAHMTEVMLASPEIYSIIKEVLKKVEMEKGVN